MSKKKVKTVETRDVWFRQPWVPVVNSEFEFRITEPGNDKKLIGRLYISKGGVIWCNRGQRREGKCGLTWEGLQKIFNARFPLQGLSK